MRAADGLTADVVAPISYAVKGRQHAYNLAAYKGRPAAERIKTQLAELLLVFLADHKHCLFPGGRPAAAVVVPSTRGRVGPHPLQTLLDDRLRLPWVSVTVNAAISAQSRSFHSNRFSVRSEQPVPLGGASVLLIDDTWTTGSRVQAASYALKKAGTRRVVAVVLGRHADPQGYAPWKPIVQEIQDRPFRLDLCAVHRS